MIRAMQVYKAYKYTKDCAKAMTWYSLKIYFEYIRRNRARKDFDEIDSDDSSPREKK